MNLREGEFGTLRKWPLHQQKAFELQRRHNEPWTPCGRMDMVRATGWWSIREALAGNVVVSDNGVRYRKRA